MKIAVPVKSNNEIDNHFGHCEFYEVYTISDTKTVINTERMESPKGCGCKSDIASVFQATGVKVLLAGGIGDGAVNVLAKHGVEVVRNCQGDADYALTQYLLGNLVDSGENCSAHSGDNSHECSHN